ncbi:MAG: radical SAM protein, partial [Clostridia bacterium]|nr:radical SAM protein [Clostridia bacterium]
MVRITEVTMRSRAYRAGVRAGDLLVSVNGEEIRDVLDYRFYLADTCVSLMCGRGGERFAVNIRKGEY